jgi:hypothetical protein
MIIKKIIFCAKVRQKLMLSKFGGIFQKKAGSSKNFGAARFLTGY